MDFQTFNKRKVELEKKYSSLYDEMKKNGNSFAERKQIALKLKLLQEMKTPPKEIPEMDVEKVYVLYRFCYFIFTENFPNMRKEFDIIYKQVKENYIWFKYNSKMLLPCGFLPPNCPHQHSEFGSPFNNI